MDFATKLAGLLQGHPDVLLNPSRRVMIQEAVRRREAIPSANGALATWTPPESTGRSPKDTYLVRRPESEDTIDWDSPNNIPMEPETFDMIEEDAFRVLSGKARLYVTDRVLGADSSYALPVKVVSDWALTALFTDNMFRPVPPDLERSILQAIRDRRLPLPDQAQAILRDKAGAPIASADFYYERGRVVVFVDGSPHYLDYVQSADERKRRQLKALGYRVVVIEAAAMEKGLHELAERVR